MGPVSVAIGSVLPVAHVVVSDARPTSELYMRYAYAGVYHIDMHSCARAGIIVIPVPGQAVLVDTIKVPWRVCLGGRYRDQPVGLNRLDPGIAGQSCCRSFRHLAGKTFQGR